MSDDKLQVVKVKMGPLFTFGLILWVIIGVIVLLAIVGAIVAAVTIVPKLVASLGAVGALAGMGNYNGTGGSGNYVSNGSGPQAYLEGLAVQLHDYIDQGNWSAARDKLNEINNTVALVPSSQLPAGLKQALSGMGQAISSRNKTAADAIFNMLNQTMG